VSSKNPFQSEALRARSTSDHSKTGSKWVDSHFAALYARREEERLAERLAACSREPAACEASFGKRLKARLAAKMPG